MIKNYEKNMKKTAVRYIRPQPFFVFKHVIKVSKSKEIMIILIDL